MLAKKNKIKIPPNLTLTFFFGIFKTNLYYEYTKVKGTFCVDIYLKIKNKNFKEIVFKLLECKSSLK